MSTRDTMELKEEMIRAQYEAALGMVFGFDHAPRLAKPLVAAVAAERSPGVGTTPWSRVRRRPAPSCGWCPTTARPRD